MKFSIFDFNQERVCALTKDVQREDGIVKTLRLDVTDLLILKEMADFMNRSQVIKFTISDSAYFALTYQTIIDDLPVLDIKKQALKDRIDKMIMLGIIKKEVVRNDCGTLTGYKLTDVYESLMYSTNEVGGCSQLHGGGVVQYTPYNNYNNNVDCVENNNEQSNEGKEKEEKEYKEKELKEKSNALFEECWVAYRRKGRKGKSKSYWDKLSDKEKSQVMPHIKAYVQAKDLQYQQDFERYLRDKTFLSVVFKNNGIIYDPTRFETNVYTPQGRTIWFNESTQSYWSDDNFYYGTISDGYTDDNRPDGATLTLNNARGDIKWNANTKKWGKK